jgi:hypothetical protein
MANLGQNLVEQQYELENVPMQRLVQMAQQPDGLFPQYLVLTELERRNRYKQAYDAEKASMVGDTTVAQDLVNESASEPPAGINTLGPSSSLSNQVNPAGGIAQAGPQMMADGGAVRYNEGGLGDIREMLGIPREGFTQREDYPPIYDDDGNIVDYDTRTELGKKFADYLNVDSKKELPSAFRNIFTPVTDTGNEAVDNTIGMIMNIPDLFLNTFDGIEGTSKKDSINLARGYPELVHEDSYQFELENFSGKYDKYKDRLKKDGVKSKLYNEGGLTSLDTSIPKPTREEIAKAREMYPDADYETILDIAAGIDTMDITTNENRYKTGGIARFNQGGRFNTMRAVPPQITSEGDDAVLDYYSAGLETLKNQRLQKEKEILERVGGDASKLTFRDSRALEFLDLEIEKTQSNLDRINKRIKRKAERVPFETEEGQTIVSDFVGTDDKVVEEVQPKEDTQTEIDELENTPDMLASEVERYAGILGLPSAEERQRNKTTSLLLGLGSAISQATQPGDIAKGFPGIQKMLVAEDRQASKDKMGILNLMANQQKLGTLSKKDKLTLLQGQVETLQKQLEQPISEKEREVILKKIADLNLLIDASLGTSNIGVQTYQEYKENRKGN